MNSFSFLRSNDNDYFKYFDCRSYSLSLIHISSPKRMSRIIKFTSIYDISKWAKKNTLFIFTAIIPEYVND